MLAIPVVAHRDGVADQQVGRRLPENIETDTASGNVPDLAFYGGGVVDNLAEGLYFGAWRKPHVVFIAADRTTAAAYTEKTFLQGDGQQPPFLAGKAAVIEATVAEILGSDCGTDNDSPTEWGDLVLSWQGLFDQSFKRLP